MVTTARIGVQLETVMARLEGTEVTAAKIGTGPGLGDDSSVEGRGCVK